MKGLEHSRNGCKPIGMNMQFVYFYLSGHPINLRSIPDLHMEVELRVEMQDISRLFFFLAFLDFSFISRKEKSLILPDPCIALKRGFGSGWG